MRIFFAAFTSLSWMLKQDGHLLLDMHPNIMPSRFINSLKTVSSQLIRKEFKAHLAQYYQKSTATKLPNGLRIFMPVI